MFELDLALELVKLCERAYDDAPLVGGLTLRGSPLLQEDTKPFSRKDGMADTEGFTGRSEGGDVVVAFRGSESKTFTPEGALTDWVMTDFNSGRIPYPPAPASWPNRRWVHGGFFHAYELVSPLVVREVQRLLGETTAADRRIHVTGHSLGGALAFLAALELGDAFGEVPVKFYSFGAPRVGDSTLNKLLAERTAARVAAPAIMHHSVSAVGVVVERTHLRAAEAFVAGVAVPTLPHRRRALIDGIEP